VALRGARCSRSRELAPSLQPYMCGVAALGVHMHIVLDLASQGTVAQPANWQAGPRRAVELEDAAVFLFGERLTAPISSIESWRQD
jgi:hypothetical protein